MRMFHTPSTLSGIGLLVILFAVAPRPARAQRRSGPPAEKRLEELVRRPMDTLATKDPETRIILYSNGTWAYYRPSLGQRLGEEAVYGSHWDTTAVFSYRDIELTDLPQVLELKIVDSLSQFCSPVRGKVLSKYGPRRRRSHNGVDIPLRTGEPVQAAFDGKVRYAQYNTGGFGYLVIVRHPNGLETWHAHLSKLNVRIGDYIKAGQVIGYVGATGRAYGPHLHFETRYCDQSFDPEFLFDFENGTLHYQTFALERSFFNIHSRASDQLDEDERDDEEIARTLLAESGDSVPSRTAQTQQTGNGPVYHTVKSGDILGRIAPRYGTTVARICQLNGIDRNSTLRIGQRLRVK